ncbi:MAG: hypothetical protein HRK26_02500 [Rickettsiaceae bacterium H1]|nr:hypothetical protein [Rickettsiaceae bacterium H1]
MLKKAFLLSFILFSKSVSPHYIPNFNFDFQSITNGEDYKALLGSAGITVPFIESDKGVIFTDIKIS